MRNVGNVLSQKRSGMEIALIGDLDEDSAKTGYGERLADIVRMGLKMIVVDSLCCWGHGILGKLEAVVVVEEGVVLLWVSGPLVLLRN